jgi:hypothetical protein
MGLMGVNVGQEWVHGFTLDVEGFRGLIDESS